MSIHQTIRSFSAVLIFALAAARCAPAASGDGGAAADASAEDRGATSDAGQSAAREGGVMEDGSAQAQDSATPPADSATPPADSASDGGSSGAVDAGAMSGGETIITIPVDQCFEFRTSRVIADCSAGNIRTAMGANVDIIALGGPMAENLCELPGTYATLAAVPTSYAACAWTGYVEGVFGLSNHGLIVRDGANHWRVRIASNAPPSLQLSIQPID